MSVTRIYAVSEKQKPDRLVEAGSAAQAIRHCVRQQFEAEAATPKDIAALMGAGIKVEKASEDPKGIE